ncbi:thioredoxin-like domain-containing protein [Anditalea andensis]|uniref:Ubiquitin carboxyl-hydrolase n=1 Tax=Anditalea andensis TaxID=1048983 RepID=A0A074L0Y9_9BACT|nr:thioredoxin-like domain-containing protein [Anditalea andensis]KEO74829.1 ubiquitin carboxyl-hydrolase [Anditalea andensis]
MKNITLIIFLSIITGSTLLAQRIESFQLTDILTNQVFSLDAHSHKKAVVLIFTSNSCPFSKLYEERISALHTKFSGDFEFALINPHIGSEEDESEEAIRGRNREKNINLPYLKDPDLKVTRAVNAMKLPEVVIITGGPTGYNIVYQGAIDNNPQVPSSVSQRYLESALTQILKRSSPSPASTRAVGCNIRGIN